MRVFVDTSAFVALRNRDEREHAAARASFKTLIDQRSDLFTSNFVVAETYTALLVRLGRSEAVTWGRSVRNSQSIEVVRVDERTEDAAWQILESHDDKLWSYVHATSFALIEQEGTLDAFAFDQHFRQRGLRVVP